MSVLCHKILYLTVIQTVENILSKAEYFITHHNYPNFQGKPNIMCQCVTAHAVFSIFFKLFQLRCWVKSGLRSYAESLTVYWNSSKHEMSVNPARHSGAIWHCWSCSMLVYLMAWCIKPLPVPMLTSPIASFMGPTWDPHGADRNQVGPMLAPWTLLSGLPFMRSSGIHKKD